ncbi:MAG: hypothetical protein Ct9H90mP22_5270 [Gammaproteobacteria bacterium]|nr:MAG: hypothetical protein Ct9H90mP22_5270 [Gammaproteobacteria bacterium]
MTNLRASLKEILSIKFPSKSKYFLPCVSLITTTLSLSLLAKLNVLLSSTSKFILLSLLKKMFVPYTARLYILKLVISKINPEAGQSKSWREIIN